MENSLKTSQKRKKELDVKISNLTGELNLIKTNESNTEKWLKLIKEYSDISELTAPLLNALIEKID